MDYSKFIKSALTLSTLWAITILLACTPPGVATATLQPDQTSIPAPAGSPSQAQTSTAALWKTYRNEAYGFTFEYPAIYDEAAYRDSCGLKENSEGIRLGLRSGLRISDSGGLSLEQYANDLLTGKDWRVDVQKNAAVSGLKAVTVEYRFGGTNRYGTFTLVKRDELIFIFEFTAGGFCDIPGGQVTEPEAYSHMLESFRLDLMTTIGASVSPAPQAPADLIHPILIYPSYESIAGYLLGGSQNGKFLDSTTTATLLQGGEQYAIYADNTFLGTGIGNAPVQNPPFCPSMQEVILNPPPLVNSIFAISGNWNALPRIPQEIPPGHEVYRMLIGDLLQSNGIADSEIRLTRILKVDFEGDGSDEVLISASHFADETGHDVMAGDYSVVVLRKVVGNAAVTIPLVADYYSQSQQLAFPNKYTLSAVLDLNGDGQMEVVVSITGWEKSGALGYEIGDTTVRDILHVRCPE